MTPFNRMLAEIINKHLALQNKSLRWLARFDRVREYHAAGMSMRQIVVHRGRSMHTVCAYVAADQFPQCATRRKVSSQLDPFVPYLHQQLEAGEDNAMQL